MLEDREQINCDNYYPVLVYYNAIDSSIFLVYCIIFIMATLDGESILTERRSELFDKMELAKAEILEKFRVFHMELHNKEVKLIQVIDKIWDDTLVKLKRIGTEFEEIEKAKDFTISTVTSNSNREFMESQVDAYNYKLDEIIGNQEWTK